MSMGPIGERILDHPWEERTGREYFKDEGGDAFNLHEKIIIGGKMYVKHSGRVIQYFGGKQKISDKFFFWEHVPKPADPGSARRLD